MDRMLGYEPSDGGSSPSPPTRWVTLWVSGLVSKTDRLRGSIPRWPASVGIHWRDRQVVTLCPNGPAGSTPARRTRRR